MRRDVLNIQSFLEVMHMVKQVVDDQWFFIPFVPTGRLKSSQYEIFIPDDFRLAFLVSQCQHMLKFILVYDQDIALWAITAMFVDWCRIVRLNVDEKMYFACQCFAPTIWAGGKPQIRMWVQDESVQRQQFANSGRCRLLSHAILAYTVQKVYHQIKSYDE